MASIIDGARNVLINHPRLVRIRQSGKPMEILVAVSDDPRANTTRKLWIRFVSFLDADPFDRTKVTFDAYLSESYNALAERTFDGIDPEVTQYVRGTTAAPGGHGRIVPWAEGTGDEAPGAEPFVIEWLPHGNPEIVGIVFARSEAEAARRCEFTDTKNPYRDRPVYKGSLSGDPDASSKLVQVTRLRDLPKFPLL